MSTGNDNLNPAKPSLRERRRAPAAWHCPNPLCPSLWNPSPLHRFPLCPRPIRPRPRRRWSRRSRPATRPRGRKKAAVLPEIARLSLEGHSNRAIGRKLGVPRRTVDRWLREQRQEWSENAPKNSVELYAVAMARLEAVYREAMEAWRRLAGRQASDRRNAEWRRRKNQGHSAKDDPAGKGWTGRLARTGHSRRDRNLQFQRQAHVYRAKSPANGRRPRPSHTGP